MCHHWIEALVNREVTMISKRGYPVGFPLPVVDRLSTTSPILLPPRGEDWKLDEWWLSPG